MLRTFLIVATAFIFQQARAQSICTLYFSDDNRNGIGSVEGECFINQKFDAGRGDSPSLRVMVRGLQHGERQTVYRRSELPRTYGAYAGGEPVFWDANRNGDGTVQGVVRFRGIEDWRSRRVYVYALIDGEEFPLWRGVLPISAP